MNLYQQAAPFLFYGSLASGIAWMVVYILPGWLSKLFSTRPMTGIPELEHCQQALIEYSGVPAERVISAAEIAASHAALVPLYAACKVLDGQQIPHPEVDKGIVLLGSAEWIDFLARVLAVRHDLEDARRVYRSMT